MTEDSVALETIRDVCLEGPGHYLGHAATLGVMQTEYVYPRLGNRMSPKEWYESERPDLLDAAIARKREILDAPDPGLIAPEIDAAIRERFAIHL